MGYLINFFYFHLGRDHQKISYERGDYESVDETSNLRLSRKTTKKTISLVKGQENSKKLNRN